MRPPNLELQRFVQHNPSFVASHPRVGRDQLSRFLSATMDEARLIYADEVAAQILEGTDSSEWNFFRMGVYRRELGRQIAYPKQRDHSAHTVNLYLLGAYLREKVPGLRDAIDAAQVARNFDADPRNFYFVWPMASLLHDIGYLFEGAANPYDVGAGSAQSNLGAIVFNEFFEHRFWHAIELAAPALRDALLKRARVALPRIVGEGFGDILVGLRNLGEIAPLIAWVREEHRNKPVVRPCVLPADTPAGDCFSVWREHYRTHKNTPMEKRFESLESYCYAAAFDGSPGIELRTLDHGACSGMVLLQASTSFYRLLEGIRSQTGTPPTASSISEDSALQKIQNAIDGAEYWPTWWWQGVCWATAAAAFHNFVQAEPARAGGPISVDEDALAYLAVLADILQDWDRFRVNPTPGGRRVPIQSVDCGLSASKVGLVTLSVPAARATKLRDDLDTSLRDWRRFVRVVGHR